MLLPLSRRSAIKLGLGAGALPLLAPPSVLAAAARSTRRGAAPDRIRARPLPLDAVRLQGGPLKHAQDLIARYLLQLEPDRMLAYYRERAGLPRKAAPYDGWDGGGRNLTGHIAGHYLSAVSLMWAATGEPRLKERADYLVRELKVVQDKHGDGYLSALEGGREAFARLARGEIQSAAFDLNGLWSPWYTLHKTFAGLRDAYRHAGNRTALAVETKFAGWAERTLSGLDDGQIQRMLNTEFGGMNEVLVDLHADTGDERWLRLSYAFEHRAFIEPLERHQDDLGGKHANTQIPKLLGSVERYVYTGRPADLLAAGFFWDSVTQHHSFATGGHGTDEYYGPPDRLSDRIDGRTCETCNVYNMLKLTRRLFSLDPDAHYADYHERALFNQILASIDPEDGRVCYMVPVGRGVTHEYQDMAHSFTCDVGTGMESHALHGLGLYYEAGDRLWVNLYAPSTAQWTEAGVRLAMDTDFPDGERARLTLSLRSPREFTLAVRRPYWVADGFAVSVNGERVATAPAPDRRRVPYDWPAPVGSYVEVARTWKSGDVVEVTLPKSLRLEPLPDNPRRASIMWGPLVLAGDLGPEGARGAVEGEALDAPAVTPVFVTDSESVAGWLKPGVTEPGRFRSDGVGREPDAAGRPRDVELILPLAPPDVLDLLGPLHYARVGGAEGRICCGGGAAAEARGRYGRLAPAGRHGVGAPVQLPSGRAQFFTTDPRALGEVWRDLVQLRPPGRSGASHEPCRHLLLGRPPGDARELRDSGGGGAGGRSGAALRRPNALLRRGVSGARPARPGQEQGGGPVPGGRRWPRRYAVRPPDDPRQDAAVASPVQSLQRSGATIRTPARPRTHIGDPMP